MTTNNPTTRRHSEPVFDRGGPRNYWALDADGRDAHDFVGWITERGCGEQNGHWAAAAARHLRSTAPDRFAAAVASWRSGRGEDVYAALFALAAEAAR